jgi:hypothetical protein
MEEDNSLHCYNEECINKTDNGGAILKKNSQGFYDTYYCSKECKAKVVMPDYSPVQKPRSVKEMQWRIQRMKDRVREKSAS